MERKTSQAFAVWITGLPASGKSTLSRELERQLTARGVTVEVLESDELRRILTPHPRYDEDERDLFYGQMGFIGGLLIKHGVSVIFDATANRRIYRDRVRQRIPRFVEVYVNTPLAVCAARDPKGIYRDARADSVPGVQAVYEPPERPEIVVDDREPPEAAAQRIISHLLSRDQRER